LMPAGGGPISERAFRRVVVRIGAELAALRWVVVRLRPDLRAEGRIESAGVGPAGRLGPRRLGDLVLLFRIRRLRRM
jgi:hypothetical protein